MNSTKKKLKKELQTAGASRAELESLLYIATSLGELKSAEQPQRTRRLRSGLLIGVPSMLGLFVGMLLVMSAQTVLPGSVLYPVQKLSDNIAIFVNPPYRGIIMMKRADQVKTLVDHHAPSNNVLAALADYQREVVSYKATTANYADFEYCKNSLEQAASTAPYPERQTINNSLQSLGNV